MITVTQTNLRKKRDTKIDDIQEITTYPTETIIYLVDGESFPISGNWKDFEHLPGFIPVQYKIMHIRGVINTKNITNVEHLVTGGSAITFLSGTKIKVMETV